VKMAGKEETGDDLEAVRTIVGALDQFDETDQQRIIRWASEKLGIGLPAAVQTPGGPQATVTSLSRPTPTVVQPPGKRDLRTFIEEKQPVSDTHFATAVAYFYRFEAPESERKAAISADDLREACRLADRRRLTNPGQTLRNAVRDGFLDRAETGSYRINAVGENLVAMTLPGGGSARAAKSLTRKKTAAKKRTGSPKKAAKSARPAGRKKKVTGQRAR
jgi:hypothetical protein